MLRSLLVAAVLLLPALALGQAGTQKQTTLVFGEGDLIEAGIQQPDVAVIEKVKSAKFGELIQIRERFDDKVLGSVSEL